VQSLIALLNGKRPAPERKTKNGVVQPAPEYYSRVQLIEGHKVNDMKFKEGSE
jgi:hypothetical protein